ncbi:putative membrane-associated protein [uncultured Sporomusa sp.]|uniref:Putative membrane-associated protein n=1 Tax=uncultured Sporomusa sp. TaxID=307249 RepID=A0A212LUJ7_9FIRM|nr:DedA family protein [uncultured Sporomusa sp.]SCM81140.1 putative membrane-associated protein [uncultured Sporomusa sp.]
MEETLFVLLNRLGENMYAAIFAAMLLTGIGVPFPGELTLGFSGYLLFIGRIELIPTVAATALGDLVGALLGFGVGFFSRSAIVTRYLGFLMPSAAKLATVNTWLKKYGALAVVVGRLLPVIRGAIPVPAGFFHMNSKKYIISTILSSVIWCSALIYAGFSLGYNWQGITELGSQLGLAAGGVVVAVLAAYLIYKYANKLREK